MANKWSIPLKFRRGDDHYRRSELSKELRGVQFLLNKLLGAKEMIFYNHLFPTLDEFDKEDRLLQTAIEHWRGLEASIHEIIKYYEELEEEE